MELIEHSFQPGNVRLSVAAIITSKESHPARTKRYGAIRASIKELGFVEPLVVSAQRGSLENYRLVDGHLRFLALKEVGETEADCIVIQEREVS